ncbi:pyridoxamine 5'-phosphate oxidase family protein [Streptomyces sp. NBC_00878]|uniref:pyridoxamine 5'-phosphate oxidase family protein n=1 Tax=Streptomyces sp. NBC_00878 TaxID=2975854 RepID=UPI002258C4B7|nr:pyridoxamine 5'-phosphate oxidase family protein [Streptomyces sp. NBC_00878]MCX4904647.1 pyridoxamine 5'-phosphate oxidase family protein [Streptomyces sp. NBC_00878]
MRDLYAVLDAGHRVGTLATVFDGEPWMVPMLYARDGDRVLFHGSTAAGALRHMADGSPVAFGVTHMDGLIYAHTMFNQSARFRSAVIRGVMRPLPDEERAEALTALTEGITPGRSHEVPPHTRKHLAATMVLFMDITDADWTVKVRDGGPTPPEPGERYDPELWRGVIPISTVFGEPIPAEGLPEGTPLSPSIQRFLASSQREES